MSVPLNEEQTRRAARWLKSTFEAIILKHAHAPFSPQIICAIACKETGAYWTDWFERGLNLTSEQVLARCVGDPGPEDDGSTAMSSRQRKYFPFNTIKFRKKFGDNFTDMLIAEGNENSIASKEGHTCKLALHGVRHISVRFAI